jgi:hypothetical protein
LSTAGNRVYWGPNHAKSKAKENLDAADSPWCRDDYRVCVGSQAEPQGIRPFVVLQEFRRQPQFGQQPQFRIKLSKLGASVGLRFVVQIEFTLEQQFVALFVWPNLSENHPSARDYFYLSRDRTDIYSGYICG